MERCGQCGHNQIIRIYNLSNNCQRPTVWRERERVIKADLGRVWARIANLLQIYKFERKKLWNLPICKFVRKCRFLPWYQYFLDLFINVSTAQKPTSVVQHVEFPSTSKRVESSAQSLFTCIIDFHNIPSFVYKLEKRACVKLNQLIKWGLEKLVGRGFPRPDHHRHDHRDHCCHRQHDDRDHDHCHDHHRQHDDDQPSLSWSSSDWVAIREVGLWFVKLSKALIN